jgi:hypothetical protein
MSILDYERIKKAKALFSKTSNDSEYRLITSFESLGNEIWFRSYQSSHLESKRLLIQIFKNYSLRFSELFFRLEQINWLQDEFKKRESKGVRSWHIFAALAIKDFLFYLSSLMDSLAPVIIEATGGIKPKDRERLSGFPDIQPRTSRSYRNKIPDEIIKIIDSTERWWPSIKEIRDTLTHREYQDIIFGNPTDGILFQIYVSGFKPKIIDKSFLWSSGKNVVDFRSYSAFVVAEILLFMEEIGSALATHLKISESTLTSSFRIGEYQYLLDSMDKLLKMGK